MNGIDLSKIFGGQTGGMILYFVVIIAVFYFLLIRPQQKKMKEHEDMLNAIKPKDEIITGGGIYAKVVKADDAVLTVEIANGVEIKISRSSVREVVSETKENSEKK